MDSIEIGTKVTIRSCGGHQGHDGSEGLVTGRYSRGTPRPYEIKVTKLVWWSMRQIGVPVGYHLCLHAGEFEVIPATQRT